MVTHQPEDARHAATHTAYLENGRILALRPTAELLAATDLPGLTAYLGTWRPAPSQLGHDGLEGASQMV